MNRLPLLLGLVVLAGAVQVLLANAVIGDPATLMAVPMALASYVVVIAMANGLGHDEAARRFLRRLAIGSLSVRLAMGTLLIASGAVWFFGGDFSTFDMVGRALANSWTGGPAIVQAVMERYLPVASAHSHGSRAGFYYFVGALYTVFGQSLYVTMVVISLMGACSSMLIYAIGRDMFDDRVGRWAAVLGAYFPSIVLWTCQGYKDGVIIFCLLLAYRCTQKLQVRMSARYFMLLSASLWSLYNVRGYIFYVAVGPVILALSNRRSGEAKAFYNQLLGIFVLSIGLIASGLSNNLLMQLQEVNLKEVSGVRKGLAADANSAIDKNADVSTPASALAYLPKGVSYFVFAPFPWQMTNLRQAITLPEMLIWWSLFPSLVRGIRRALKDRLGESSGILIFLVALTLVYGLAQGNVGTAYRMRAQLLVFYFIFAAAGIRESHWITRILPKLSADESLKALPGTVGA